ncbi:MAG: class I SAM-dependent methyltransferase [Sulfuricaulis sp.]|uniref:class I SAM-dependent methyltransferase n=1 Tax=Sulfuricaulis sp. TaxID=2003553 RepID=UPI003C37CF41
MTGDDNARASAEELARELKLPFVTTAEADFDLLLVVTPERLELRDNSARSGIGRASARPEGRRARDGAHHNHDPQMGPVCVDFSHLDLRPYSPNLSRRQPLARALGKKAQSVVDATAGYCQDALLFALMGYRTTAIERSPVIMALARDGLRRLTARSGITLDKRLRLIEGDGRVLLPSITPPEVIYLDPMFPPKRKKSAAVKKEMRLLRDLVGDDPDAKELLEISRRVALDRVVVKRPDDAPPLAPKPSMSLAGKLVRYDVYLTRH